MTTLSRLNRYREALEKHAKARANNDPWSGNVEAPRPEDYGLKSPEERFAARLVEKEVMGRKAEK